MKLLTDRDLVALIESNTEIIDGLPSTDDWYTKESPIQPACIDLHIGAIVVPGRKSQDPGGRDNPVTEHILGKGSTVVVSTKEKFNLPADMGGIGFPSYSVSSRGILMTSPGHIDPGYKGPLHLTIINMGKQNYVLREAGKIATILLFQLPAPVESDWVKRHGERSPKVPQETLDRLSVDFLDVTARAGDIAKNIAKDVVAEERSKTWRDLLFGTTIPFFVAIAATVGVFLVTFLVITSDWKRDVLEIRSEIIYLERDLNDLRERLGSSEVPPDQPSQ